MTTRRYAIVGTGALGGYYGARLAHAGLEVHFLFRGDYEHVRAHGLLVESKDGDFSLNPIAAYCRVDEMPVCDVVCVTLKSTENDQLAALLPPLVGPDSLVLVMQNGLGVESQAAQIVGPERVIGAMCFLCSNKVGPGHIRHLDYGSVTLAAFHPDCKPGGVTDPMRRIAAELECAGIAVRLADDLLLARWKKLLWNVPFNGLSVLLNGTTSDIMGFADSRLLAERLMVELADDARAFGRELSRTFIDRMLQDTARMAPYRPSMKIDYDNHRPMEIEAIFGNPLRAANAAGRESPRLELLYRILATLDVRNRR